MTEPAGRAGTASRRAARRWGPARGALRRPHYRWLLLHAVGLSAVINLVVNAGWSWLTTRGRPSVPMWSWPVFGGSGTVMGALGILLVLPAATTVFTTLAVRRELARERLAPLLVEDLPPVLSRLPAGLLARAATGGLITLAALGPVSTAVAVATGFGPISPGAYILYTATLAIALGLVVTPPIALRAMADPPLGATAGPAPAAAGPDPWDPDRAPPCGTP